MPRVNKITKTDDMEKSSPIDLQELMNDVALQTTDVAIKFPSRFTFSWQNINFSGQILRSESPGIFSMNLVANLGYIPFSSEDKTRRKDLLTTFTPSFIKGDYNLSMNSQIQMVLFTEFSGPVNAKRLMEAITYSLIDVRDNFKSTQEAITN